MGLLKDVKEIKKNVEKINKSIDTKVVEKAKKYDEQVKYLNNIVLDLKISKKINPLGEEEYTLSYTLPPITLKFDENGELEENSLFTSINMLDLIKIDDMNRIHDIIFVKNKKR